MNNLAIIFWFLFTYISLLLYIVVLAIIARERHNTHLNSSFFIISFFLGLSEIGSTVFIHFYQIWPKFGFFIDSFYLKSVKGYFVLMCDQWNWMLLNLQSYLILLAAINRTFAMVYPAAYLKVFTRKPTIYVCFIITIVTSLIFIPITFLTSSRYVDNRLNPDGNITQAMCSMDNKAVQNTYVFFISLVQLLVSIFGLILYSKILAVILRHRFTSQRRRSVLIPVEVRLSMTIFFQVVIYAVNSTVVCLGYFILTQQHHSFIEISYITGDVTSMSTPYFLLFFSSRLRQALIRILPFQQTITVIRIPTVKFSVSRSSNLPTTVVKTT